MVYNYCQHNLLLGMTYATLDIRVGYDIAHLTRSAVATVLGMVVNW